jgi:hypothetical protein
VTGIVGFRRGSLRLWERGCESLLVSDLCVLVWMVVWHVGYRYSPLTQGRWASSATGWVHYGRSRASVGPLSSRGVVAR